MGNQISSDEEDLPLTSARSDADPNTEAISFYETWMQERGLLEKNMDDCSYRDYSRHEEVMKLAKNPNESIQLQKQAKDAQTLMATFQHYIPTDDGEDVLDSITDGKTLVPSMTFGDVLIPGAFINTDRAVDPNALSRKYLLLDTDTDSEKVWQLLTKTWKLPHPNLVISLISGDLRADSTLPSELDAMYSFCAQTGVWILTDGMHHGSSLLLSKKMGFCRESAATDLNDVTLIGFPQWHSLRKGNRPLLYGSSYEHFYDSYYFYPVKNELEAGEVVDIVNPFQNAYLFENTIDSSRGSLRTKLVKDLRQKHRPGEQPNDNDAYKGKAFLPTVNLVIGGSNSEEEVILSQIKMAVENNFPVIIVSDSGHVPIKIKEHFMELEKIERRSNVREPGFNDAEVRKLKELVGLDPLYSVWKCILEHRYYLTLLDTWTPAAFIAGILKGKKHEECLPTALLTCSHEFVKATITREIDPNFDEGLKQVDQEELSHLHALNLSHNGRMKRIIFDEMDVLVNEKNSLALVGKSLFKMMGWRYVVQYQNKATFASQLRDRRTQIWHIFIYAILSNKDIDTVKFLASLTKSPLGAAIFAHKLYKALSCRARSWLEDDFGDIFESNAKTFIELAENMLKQMYATSKTEAYKSLNQTLPFNMGDDVTALSLAVDSVARSFISSPCCQTFISTVWMGRVRPCLWRQIVSLIFPVVGWIFLPTITVSDDSDGPCCVATSRRLRDQPTVCQRNCCFYPLCICSAFCARNLGCFYSAPLTKFLFDLACYLGFLAVFSCFLLIDLQPLSSVSDVNITEWLTYCFVAGKILEEVLQVYETSQTCGTKLSRGSWSVRDKLLVKTRVFKLKHYFSQGSWNTLDCLMLVLFVVSTVCRFAVSFDNFQMVRILFCVTILLFYTRLLRYMYLFEKIGPRVIAITLMLAELAKMCLVLIVFIIGFGVAFQAVLNPGQPASEDVFFDLLYRPYWQMYGELFLDDATSGMGRPVGNSSCTFLKENGHPDMNCFNAFPYFLVAVYLIVSNVLLLNLVIAIFGNTLSSVEDKSKVHWAFEKCILAHEYYNKTWLPSPFNLVWCTFVGLHSFLTCLCKKCGKNDSATTKEHAFRRKPLEEVDHFQTRAYLKLSRPAPGS